MNYLSDTLTVGLVLILLFGSIALFLYTRVQQAEQKMSLLESILLNLKIASEVKAYDDLPEDDVHVAAEPVVNNSCVVDVRPATPTESVSEKKEEAYTPFEEEDAHPVDTPSENKDEVYAPFEDVEEPSSASLSELPISSSVSQEYNQMTVKELQALAKMRGLTISASAKKAGIIEALKAAEQSPSGSLSSSALLENPSMVSDEL